MDMIRFHKFTIGHAWRNEYGDPEKEDDFMNILKYSPLHNVNNDDKEYPAMLITTGDHDDRVVPLHSYKFTATLQYELGNSEKQINPLMIRVDTNSGHNGSDNMNDIINELTEKYSFVGRALNI
jgi:prolyl oligopeptidase